MIYSETLNNAIIAVNQGLDLFESADIEDSGESVISEYRTNGSIDMRAKIVDKLNLLDQWLASQFKTTVDLYDYWENAGNRLSRDRIKTWDVDPDNYNDTDFIELMLDMLGDEFGYLFAAQMLGDGVGLWELFDKDMPDLFCIC